ncbi:hypothetical protein A8F94_17540 [Bacillus sp. FJAT-27225]|uniref:hypothetical protein n=1 Tax=Bacillus sp. FJAT-27225 TaxID=1743144 RepID=UPI00080C2B25|nr:hypothetical protein [Bacillus sp. FJAT-27225]OCA84497.1 hypothetical protein A8F94_17540 [Bacillus sp. FJAT-27225]
MNFETKYLIRWGIPGWIMIMALTPYLYFTFIDLIKDDVSKPSELLAAGAVVTVLGVPLGYLLNQLHHSLTWVIPRIGKWDKYFSEEIKIDEYLMSIDKGNERKERYRYLLSRKHELGGITMSLGLSALIIGLTNFQINSKVDWHWIYFFIVLGLFVFILISRFYSGANIMKYHKYYLREHNKNQK